MDPQVPTQSSVQLSVETQPVVQSPSDGSKKMLIVLAIIVLMIAIAFGAYMLRKPTANKQEVAKIVPSPIPSVTSLPDPTTNWETYTSKIFGYQMKHPDLLLNKCNVGGMRPTDTLDVVLAQGQPREGTGYCGTYTISVFVDTQTNKSVSEKLEEFISFQTEKEGIIGGKREDYMQTNTTVGNISTIKLTSKTTSGFAIYAFSRKNTVYYIQIDNNSDTSDSMNEIDKILSTFKFTDQAIDTSHWKTYTNQLTFKYPSDWIITRGQAVGESDVSLRSPDYSLSKEPGIQTLEIGAEIIPMAHVTEESDVDKEFAKTPLSEQLVRNKRYITVDGQRALQYDFSYESTTATDTRFIKNKISYIILFKYPDETTKQKYWDIYIKLLESFKGV